MSPGISAIQTSSYQVYTPVFEGPLDLLLQLIERAELDITSLALAQVTDQYLEHLRHLQDRSAEEVSAFLVIAARLLQIKSEALLPRPPRREPGEEDPGEALAQQLLLYKRFRQAADLLAKREAAGLRGYLRLAKPPKLEGVLDLSGVTVEDLAQALLQLNAQENQRLPLSSLVKPPRVTIREKIMLIAQKLSQRRVTTFQSLVDAYRTRLDVVVTFLALLELVKRHFVLARQEALFGEIAIEATDSWNQDEEFELEFGE